MAQDPEGHADCSGHGGIGLEALNPKSFGGGFSGFNFAAQNRRRKRQRMVAQQQQ